MAGDQNSILFQDGSLPVPTSTFSPPLRGTIFSSDLENAGLDEEINFQPAKKRRLTANQVQFMEKNFEEENKLEPERKLKIAGELGLQPRQVAIWFQNRRARLKNKQLEKDYGSLSASYEKLKTGYDNLVKEKENLENEIVSLKQKLHIGERGMETLEPIDSMKSCPKSIPEANCGKISYIPKVITPKQEDASSAKSDIFDSDSPMPLLVPGDSSQAFEPDQSEFSQDEVEDPSRSSFLSSLYFPNSCNLELQLEDQPFWSWTY